MDGVIQLQRQLSDYTTSLYKEGFLDDQFKQLQQLQDESNPDFVVEVVYLFFEDSERLINELAKTLSQQSMDFKKMDAHVHQLKGSSSSIGAQRVQKVCIAFRNYCEEQNTDGAFLKSYIGPPNTFGTEIPHSNIRCLKCLQLLKNEYSLVKKSLETLFKMEKQILAAGGSVPLH